MIWPNDKELTYVNVGVVSHIMTDTVYIRANMCIYVNVRINRYIYSSVFEYMVMHSAYLCVYGKVCSASC